MLSCHSVGHIHRACLYPLCIRIQNSQVEGTYKVMERFFKGRPAYRREDDFDYIIRYHPETRRWIVDNQGFR
eukprot:3929740-Amphidinium_carterae.1